jgi:3-hydroxybutyryl-CoA dehydratase
MSLAVGKRAVVRRTVSEAAVDIYCGITGDLDPLHVDEEFAASTPYGRRIAPGALVVGLMMAAATRATADEDVVAPSLGFDRVRHTAPVFLGDTLEVVYEIATIEGDRGTAKIEVTNQRGETVGVAVHVFKLLPPR